MNFVIIQHPGKKSGSGRGCLHTGRGSMDASEYKHVILGLIFLKYISDRFEFKYNELKAEGGLGQPARLKGPYDPACKPYMFNSQFTDGWSLSE